MIIGYASVSTKNSGLQVYGQQEMNQTEQRPQMSSYDKNGYHMNAQIDLQLSQPAQENNETSTKTMKLG